MKNQEGELGNLPEVYKILSECSLPIECVEKSITDFILAWDGDRIIGVIGLEVYEGYGLLRSFSVIPDYRERGVGRELYSRLVVYAKSLRIKKLYLLTTSAEGFFMITVSVPILFGTKFDRRDVLS